MHLRGPGLITTVTRDKHAIASKDLALHQVCSCCRGGDQVDKNLATLVVQGSEGAVEGSHRVLDLSPRFNESVYDSVGPVDQGERKLGRFWLGRCSVQSRG